MLGNHERQLLAESLQAPPGYTLDEALGTTFSLDLLALAAVPLAACGLDTAVGAEDDQLDRLALLEVMRRNMKRFTICCQAGAILSGREFRDEFVWLEQCIAQVSPAREKSVFHPKIWILRFVDSTGDVLYRFLCVTRNLTFDRSWDTVLCMEGRLKGRTVKKSKPLADFLHGLANQRYTPALSEENRARIVRFANAAERLAFDTPEGWDDFHFWPIGMNPRAYEMRNLFTSEQDSRSPFAAFNRVAGQSGRRLLVVSPFVSNGFVQALATAPNEHQLVSRHDSIDMLDPAMLAPFAATEATQLWGFNDASADQETPFNGLHAKLFVADDGWNAHLWTGSANATVAAFCRNIEFLVQLTGSKSRFGIELLMQERTDKQPGNLRSLLQPYLASTVEPDPQAMLDKQWQQELDYMARAVIAGGDLGARVEHNGGNGYDMQVSVATRALQPIGGRLPALYCYPISLAPHQAQLAGASGAGLGARFTNLTMSQLTEFVVIELRLPGSELRQSAAAHIEVAGMPERQERSANARMKYLNSLDDMASYFNLLLAGDDAALARIIRKGSTRGKPARRRSSNAASGIFETLMRGFANDPARFDELDKLVIEMGQNNDTMDKASLAELASMWAPFREARKRIPT